MTVSRHRVAARAATLLPVLAIAAAALAANIYALRHPARIELQRAGAATLRPATVRLLDSLSSPVQITYFYDLRDRVMTDALATLQRYAARSPHIQLQSFDPTLEPGAARRHGIRFPGTALFRTAERHAVVHGGSEADFNRGLLRVTRSAAGRLCFSTGHAENDPWSRERHDHAEAEADHHHRGGPPLRLRQSDGLSMARESLETLGYEIEPRLLLRGEDPLAHCAALVVASPRTPFHPREVERLRVYLAGGGRALLLLEPGVESGLGPVLADFGIAVTGEHVRDLAHHYGTDPSTPVVSRYPSHRITRGLAMTLFPGVTSLVPAPGGIPDDVRIIPLLKTSPAAHLEATAHHGAKTGGAAKPHTLLIYAVRRSKEPGEGKATRQAHLAVAGDGDFATNAYFSVLGNGALFLNLVAATADAPEPPEPVLDDDPALRLSNRQLRMSFFLSTALLPSLLLGVGLWQWKRRR